MMGLNLALPRRALALGAAVAVLCPMMVLLATRPAHADVGVGVDVEVLDKVDIDTSNPQGATTTSALQAGVPYRIDVTGVYQYGGPGLADAECSTGPTDPTWKPNRFAGFFPQDPAADWLDLYVGGKKVTWRPVSGTSCDSTNHHYVIDIVPDATGPLSFGVRDVYYGDNVGVLHASVFLGAGVVDVQYSGLL